MTAPGGLGVDGMMPGDISGFLDDKKHVIDRDPDTNPFDDVRHYAYEGDGNTTGSLSSLASCKLFFIIFLIRNTLSSLSCATVSIPIE